MLAKLVYNQMGVCTPTPPFPDRAIGRRQKRGVGALGVVGRLFMEKTRQLIGLVIAIIAIPLLMYLSITDYVQFLRVWGFSSLDVIFMMGALVVFLAFVGTELRSKAKSTGWKSMMMAIALFVIFVLFYWMMLRTAPRYSELINSLWPFAFSGFFIAWFIKEKRRRPTRAI